MKSAQRSTEAKSVRNIFAAVKRGRNSYTFILTGFDPWPNDDFINQFGYDLEARPEKARSKAGLGSRPEAISCQQLPKWPKASL